MMKALGANPLKEMHLLLYCKSSTSSDNFQEYNLQSGRFYQ